MKSRLITGVLICGIAFSFTPLSAQAEPQVVDGIAAIVNSKIITFSDVKMMSMSAEQDIIKYYPADQVKDKLRQARLDALNNLIERTLIIQEAEGKGIQIPEYYIDNRLKEVIRTDFEGDRNKFLKTLIARNETQEQYRQKIRELIIIQVMRSRQVSDELIISPFKVEQYYKDHLSDFQMEDQVRLKLIKISKEPEGNEEQRKEERALAENLLSELKQGADFSELAQKHSDSAERRKGGEVGRVKRSDLRKELADAAFGIKPGNYSGIIDLNDGYYVLQVLEIIPAHTLSLEESRESIEKILIQEERTRLHQKWIDRLKQKAYIRYF